MKLTTQAITHVGMVREKNEDSFHVSQDNSLFAVFDGMGGCSGGDVASQQATALLQSWEKSFHGYDVRPKDVIADFLYSADKAIQQIGAQNPSLRGLGSTAVIAKIVERTVEKEEKEFLTQVLNLGLLGDTRAYLFRRGRLYQLGIDHSWYHSKILQGERVNREEAEDYAGAISACLGSEHSEGVQLYSITVFPKDLVFLCSDGLHSVLSHQEMVEVITRVVHMKLPKNEDFIKELNHQFRDEANARGGEDNITVASCLVGFDQPEISKEDSVGTRWILGSGRGRLTHPLRMGAIKEKLLNLSAKHFLSSSQGHSCYIMDTPRLKASFQQSGESWDRDWQEHSEKIWSEYQKNNTIKQVKVDPKRKKNSSFLARFMLVVALVCAFLAVTWYYHEKLPVSLQGYVKEGFEKLGLPLGHPPRHGSLQGLEVDSKRLESALLWESWSQSLLLSDEKPPARVSSPDRVVLAKLRSHILYRHDDSYPGFLASLQDTYPGMSPRAADELTLQKIVYDIGQHFGKQKKVTPGVVQQFRQRLQSLVKRDTGVQKYAAFNELLLFLFTKNFSLDIAEVERRISAIDSHSLDPYYQSIVAYMMHRYLLRTEDALKVAMESFIKNKNIPLTKTILIEIIGAANPAQLSRVKILQSEFAGMGRSQMVKKIFHSLLVSDVSYLKHYDSSPRFFYSHRVTLPEHDSAVMGLLAQQSLRLHEISLYKCFLELQFKSHTSRCGTLGDYIEEVDSYFAGLEKPEEDMMHVYLLRQSLNINQARILQGNLEKLEETHHPRNWAAYYHFANARLMELQGKGKSAVRLEIERSLISDPNFTPARKALSKGSTVGIGL